MRFGRIGASVVASRPWPPRNLDRLSGRLGTRRRPLSLQGRRVRRCQNLDAPPRRDEVDRPSPESISPVRRKQHSIRPPDRDGDRRRALGERLRVRGLRDQARRGLGEESLEKVRPEVGPQGDQGSSGVRGDRLRRPARRALSHLPGGVAFGRGVRRDRRKRLARRQKRPGPGRPMRRLRRRRIGGQVQRVRLDGQPEGPDLGRRDAVCPSPSELDRVPRHRRRRRGRSIRSPRRSDRLRPQTPGGRPHHQRDSPGDRRLHLYRRGGLRLHQG